MTHLVDRRWRTALFFALAAALSGVFLVGVSAWFLGAVALAGLGPAAYAFGFHHPSAIIRALALTRTVAKYGERVTGHVAALRDQTEHRSALFSHLAAAPDTRAQGWQLARTDRLQSFLGDVEQVDFARLRVALPTFSAVAATIAVSILTLWASPLALAVVPLQGATLLLAALRLAYSADEHAAGAEAGHRRSGEALGQQLAGLVSLEGGGERASRVAESVACARSAERDAARMRLRLGVADAVLSALGPLSAAATLTVAAATGSLGEAALPALFAAFAWLALGELCVPLARAAFARAGAARARTTLAAWQDDMRSAPPRTVDMINLDAALRDPLGNDLGHRVRLSAKPGSPAALVGPSGCGKTTLLKEIAGWLPWTDGPHPIGDEASARSSCHLNLHDAAILDGTIRDNLFTEAEDGQLWAALEAVELGARLRGASGLDARITQDGLSLGEARRIALARAFLTSAPVVLLDEPGEHLDADQAERIIRRLLIALAGQMVLMATHEDGLAALALSRCEVR